MQFGSIEGQTVEALWKVMRLYLYIGLKIKEMVRFICFFESSISQNHYKI